MIYNPNKPIRAAIISAITGIPVWHKKVPKNVSRPTRYILLTSQAKRTIELSKCGWEWSASINIDIIQINSQGYSNAAPIDDIEQQVINAVQGLTVAGWDLKGIELVDSNDLDLETDDESIERRVLTYNFWIWPV